MLKVYKKLLCYVTRERWMAYVGILFTTVSTVITVWSYYFLYEFFRRLVVAEEPEEALRCGGLIVGLLAGGFLIYIFSVLLTHVLGFRLETNLRKRGIDGLMQASFQFFDLNSSGRIRQIIDDNAALTHTIVAHLIPDNAAALIKPVLVLILGFVIDWRVGLVLLAFTAVGAVMVKGMAGDNRFLDIYQNALERMNSETVEYVRGMQVVKIFGASVDSMKALYASIMDYSRYAMEYVMSCRRSYVWFQTIFLGGIVIVTPFVMVFGDLQADPRGLAVRLIMLFFLSGVLFGGFMKIMYVSMYAYMGTSAVEKLEQIFDDMKRDRLEFGTLEKFDHFDIEFDQVSFGYGEQLVLDHLSFKLEENKSYALVGDSGSGKSTVAKLISGFYKINGGEIRIGGRSLTSYSEEAVAKNIAFVFQDSRLFQMSIYENVKTANPAAPREQVMEALHLAGCDDILSKFPERENTVIGSEGVFLSGGEKQRIAIARAMLKDAGIIIMDEASAAVDPENEHELQKAFKNLIRKKTVLMIAHRLSSIRSVDEILVMENGKIIERGSDSQLMGRESRYKHFQELYAEANDWRVAL